MPAAIAIPAIASLAGAGIAAYGAHSASNANRQADVLQAKGNTDALDFQKAQEAERVKEYNDQKTAAQAAWDAEQARRAPYRQAAQGAMINLARLAGVAAPTTALPAPSAAPPPGWMPGASTGAVPMSSLVPPVNGSQTDALAATVMNQSRRIALGLPGGGNY